MIELEEHPILKKGWELYQDLLDFFFPPLCLSCDERLLPDEEYYCGICYGDFEYMPRPVCAVCGAPLGSRVIEKDTCPDCPPKPIYFDLARAPLLYDGPVVPGVIALKFNHRLEMAEYFSRILFYYIKTEMKDEAFDAIVPVPLHFKRYLKRGYNQAEEMGRFLSKNLGMPLLPEVMKRIRNTPPQTRLEHSRRKKNVAGAFEVFYPDPIKDRHIILLDDVYTTGSTLNAAASALKSAGASKVTALALCRAIKAP
ncbi:ComF family protein [Candidatus Sumerlaeota bacterium]|nr:ComF family protein [Candidatus Sumerlaeota bacterium]